jgi:hypothetical protein
MSRDWDGTSLYSSSFGAVPGFQSDDGDMAATALDTQYGMTTGSQIWFDVTSYLEGVRNGTPDHGLIVLHGQDTSDGWQIQLASGPDETLRPKLVVISDLSSVAAGLAGDFNNDGKVDAGDYATWRKNEAANVALANDNGVGNQAARFALWRANFGKPPGAGSGLGGSAVPEPSMALLGGMMAFALGVCRMRRG